MANYQQEIDHIGCQIAQHEDSIRQHERATEDLREKQGLLQKILDLDEQCSALAAQLAVVPVAEIRRMNQEVVLSKDAVLFVGRKITGWLESFSPKED